MRTISATNLKSGPIKLLIRNVLLPSYRTKKGLDCDSFRDQLESLSNKIASLEATGASASVAAREVEDEVNSKVNSQPEANATSAPDAVGESLGEINIEINVESKATEYVMGVNAYLPPWSVMEQASSKCRPPDGLVEAMLQVQKFVATFGRTKCPTHVDGAEHLPGPCNVCGTYPLSSHIPDSVT